MFSTIPFLLLLGSSLVASRATPNSGATTDIAERAADNKAVNFVKRNLDTITKIYERNVYPTNLEFITKGPSSVPPGLFNANASGRITPLGNFTGFNDSTEYFFALSPVPQAPTYYGFSKIQIVEFQSQCANIASSVVYITMSVINPGAANNGTVVGTLKQVHYSSPQKHLTTSPLLNQIN